MNGECEENLNVDQKDAKDHVDYNYIQGKLCTNVPLGEEIVISGLSGTFPNSTDIYHFQYNLLNKVNMVLPNRRWEYKHPEVPVRSGTLPIINTYDAGFFGVHRQQGEAQDAPGRILLEKTVEAIFDAGMHLEDFEGTNTGVYLGTCFSETEKSVLLDNVGPDPRKAVTGLIRSTVAQRISYFLKLKGPSIVSDTACSSSLFALENAYRDLKAGIVESAIVCGANMVIHPFISLQFSRLGVLSLDGSCKVFDKTGDGYARSEAICVILLQKSKNAKRKYADVIYVKTNCDGYKEAGITYPSGEMQRQLMTEVYNDAGVNPADLSFLEAHGTGTFVGDPEECGAIDDTLAKCRKDPLLIGSVKSNIGHSEPASGLCSITKCIIASETGIIPPNIHYTCPREEIRGLVEGRMEVVTEKRPFKDNRGLMGINNFGFGGGNCHVLLKSNLKEKLNGGLPQDDIPRVICVSGRTTDSLLTIFDEIKSNSLDAEYVSLLHNAFRKQVRNHLYRGYSIVAKSGEICRYTEPLVGNKTPLYFAFGEVNEWYEFGNALKLIPAFADTLEKVQRILLPKAININEVFEEHESTSPKNQVLGSILVQLCVIDIFKMLDIQPTNYFGYSFGELLAAYYDQILTFKQTVECAYAISDVVEKVNCIDKGKEIKTANHLHNNHISVSLSSLLNSFRAKFKSTECSSIKKELVANLSNILDNTSKVTSKKDLEKFGSADYFISALMNNTSNKLEYIEKNSVVLRFGEIPSLDVAIEGVKVIPLVPENETDYLTGFLKILGNLYVNGYNPQLAKLYPEVSFPVSRGTRMISPFIKWEHTRDWFVPSYNLEMSKTAQHGARTVKILVKDQQWNFVQGHVIDGRNLFPATGYLYMVWETLSIIQDIPLTIKNIVFEDVRFQRATNLPKSGLVKFTIYINSLSGKFEIVEGGVPIVTGKIHSEKDDSVIHTYCNDTIGKNSGVLTKKDVYKELRLRGYNYSGEFQNIEAYDPVQNVGLIKWTDNWISFMDNMLQMKIVASDTRLLYVPTYISLLKIPAKSILEWVNKSYLQKQLEPILPVYINETTSEIRCGDLVIQGLIASSIARRKDFGIPVLESHIFVPNITELELEESIRVNLQIIIENSFARQVKTIELIDEFIGQESILLPLVETALGDQPLLQAAVKVLAKNRPEYVPETIELEDKELATETDCHLIIGCKLIQRKDVLTTALKCLKDNGFLISREDLNFDTSITKVEDFTVFTVHKTPLETLVLLKKNFKLKELIAIDIERSDDLSWIEELKEIVKSKKSDNVLVYAHNKALSGIMGFFNCLKREPDSTYMRCLFTFDADEAFDLDNEFYKTQLSKNMAVNIWKDNQWGTYRHLLLKSLDTIETEHCYANVTLRGDLSSLRWIENTNKYDMIVPNEKKLVYIHYAAMNFRDIMTATGKINADVISQDRLDQECVQGIEFSGYTADGRRVMGMIPHGAMSTLLIADQYFIFDVPDNISLKDAATLPGVYGTLLYGLICRANMKRGSSILIHSGTGGIGQAAIRIALEYGCNIFTTVGTKEKREFLLKNFPKIKPHQIGNSRDISFEGMIKQYTGGKGVDLVLNSLSEEKLQASVRCLAPGGSFLEIGKFDLAQNKEINLLFLQKECSFHGIMLDQIFHASPKIKSDVTKILVDNLGKYIVPLNTTCFQYDQLEEAFRYMASGKHMGKVLIKVREIEQPPKPVPELFKAIPRYYCYPDKSYILIGGLGGFGLELADWLVLRGAKKLVLVSRKGVTTGYQNLRIRLWQSYGTIVHISQDDVCTEEGCRKLLQTANSLGDVHTIFNLGVVLADSIFENQTVETFKTSFGPKAVATQHLDKLSREMCPKLEGFVIFSSVSCGRGNAGQTNYGMANSVMERICELRKKDGLPALAIQWGAIGDVGLVAELQENHVQLEIGGTLQQKISNCLSVLNTFLTQKQATIVSSIVVAEKRGGLGGSGSVVDAVINILGMSDSKMISHHATLPELGMDSMTGVEIKQTLEREFDIFLTPKDMKSMTLHKLKEIQEKKVMALETEQLSDFAIIFSDVGEETDVKQTELTLPSQLKENEQNDTILLFPGIEGLGKRFTTLASRLSAHAISYQYWDSIEYPSVQALAESLLPKVESHIKEKGKFKILAYSFGASIALEVVHLLENKGYTGEVIVVDGGPTFINKLTKPFSTLSEAEFETSLISHLLSYSLPSNIIVNHQEKMVKCNTWNERLDLGEEVLKTNKISDQSTAFKRFLASGFYNRAKLAMSYVQSFTNIKSKITLIAPEESIINDIEIDRGLSSITENKVDIVTAKGNHVTVLENDEIGEIVNSIFNNN